MPEKENEILNRAFPSYIDIDDNTVRKPDQLIRFVPVESRDYGIIAARGVGRKYYIDPRVTHEPIDGLGWEM